MCREAGARRPIAQKSSVAALHSATRSCRHRSATLGTLWAIGKLPHLFFIGCLCRRRDHFKRDFFDIVAPCSVSWQQLEADVGRDNVRIDGTEYQTANVRTLVTALADRIVHHLKRPRGVSGAAAGAGGRGTPGLKHHRRGASLESSGDMIDSRSTPRYFHERGPSWEADFASTGSATPTMDARSTMSSRTGEGDDDDASDSDSSDEASVSLFSKSVGQEAQILEFARDVLLCSSRTVTGGDPLFASELVRLAFTGCGGYDD